jgi:hypothetical protein
LAGFGEHGNKCFGFMKFGGIFLISRASMSFSRTLLHVISSLLLPEKYRSKNIVQSAL